MAAPAAAADLQDLPTALANLGLLSGRIGQLQTRGVTFRQTLQDALNSIVTRLAAVRALVGRQGGAGAELLQLQRQIREGAPTHAQIRTLNDIFQLLDPTALTTQLNALETEVGQLESAVGILDQAGAAPVQGPQPRVGGFLYSRKANRSRNNRSRIKKKKSRKKRKNKPTRRKKKRNKKHDKTGKYKRK